MEMIMQSEFYQTAGLMALGSRLRQLSERITSEAARIYESYQVTLEPRWFPVFYALMQQDGQSVMQLAEKIGHSQASVSQISKEMQKQEMIVVSKDPNDARKTILTLSEKSRELVPMLRTQMEDVGNAVSAMLTQTRNNIWDGMDELDYLLEQETLYDRVKQERKRRESKDVSIVSYTPEYREAFRQLNIDWITTYFEMEPSDYEALDSAEEKILKPGGKILIALYQNEPVGTCALIRMDEHTVELAKMAVSPKAQGKNIGYLLGKRSIELAKELGADTVYLESNTLLKPAINLYHKLGFKRVIGKQSPYQRCNIQMELTID